MLINRFLLFSLAVFAVPHVFSAPLTLDECLQRARQNSFALKARERRVDAAHKSYQLERSRALPQISGVLSTEQRLLDPYSFNQTLALARADWALGDLIVKKAQSASFERDAVQSEKEQQELDVVRRTSLLYLGTLYQQKQIEVLQNRLELLRSHRQVAYALWQAGSRTQLDLLQTDSQLSKLQEELASLKANKETLLLELARLLGMQDAEPELAVLPVDSILQKPTPAFAAADLQRTPLLQSLSFRIQAQHIRIRAVTAQQLPRVYFAGGFMTDRDPTGDGSYWQLNAGVQAPLYRFGASRLQRQQASALLSMLEEQRRDLERELAIRVNRILKKLASLKEIHALQQKRLALNKEAFQIAEANYQAGLATNLDYLAAQEQLAEIHISIRKTQLQYVMNLIEYYATTNQLEKLSAL